MRCEIRETHSLQANPHMSTFRFFNVEPSTCRLPTFYNCILSTVPYARYKLLNFGISAINSSLVYTHLGTFGMVLVRSRALAIKVLHLYTMTAFLTAATLRFKPSSFPGLKPASNKCAALGRPTVCMASHTPNGLPNGHEQEKEDTTSTQSTPQVRNVLGGPLELCCNSPRTGFYRDGFCHTGPSDNGFHTVCCRVTMDFLEFSRSRGNDLISPAPQFGFPGLKEGDGWCVCASRWLEAAQAGHACPIVLASTHERTLQIVPLELLRQHAIDAEPAQA